jgi:hypothetical protein
LINSFPPRGDSEDDPEGGSGVREPRRPIKPTLDGTATLDPEDGDEP